jgi:hypothetical protein
MATSNTRSAEILTAVHCFTFSVLLLLSAFTLTLAFTHAVIISASTIAAKTALLSANVIIPTCSLLFLSLEHLLEMVQPKTLTIYNRHQSILMLSVLLFWGWFINTLFWTQYKIPKTTQGSCPSQNLEHWRSTSTTINKAKIGLGWIIVTIYIIHLSIRAVKTREEIQRQRWLTKVLKSELDVEVVEITAEEGKGRTNCEL